MTTTIKTCLFLVIIFLAVTGFYYQGQRGLKANDDNLWLYFLSQKFQQPEKAVHLENTALAYAREHGAESKSLLRLEMRRDYSQNYIIPVTIWSGISALLPKPDSNTYVEYLGKFLPLMTAITSLIAWGLFLVVLSRIKESRLLLASVFGIAGIAALSTASYFVSYSSTEHLLAKQDLVEFGYNFFRFALDPRYGYSIFGSTPRNYLAALIVTVFLMRWNGNIRMSYMIMLPLFGIHSSLSFLLLVHVLALDFISQRPALRDPWIMASIVIGISYGLWRETLWSSIGDSMAVKGILFALPVILLSLILIPVVLPLHIMRLHERLKTLRLPALDVVLLLIFWIATLPVVYLISTQMSAEQNMYFWHQLHGRSIGMLQPVLAIGITYFVLEKFYSPRRYIIALICLLAVWVAGFSGQAKNKPSPVALCTSQLRDAERRLTGDEKTSAPPGFIFDEQVFYYALGRMLSLDENRWNDLIKTTNVEKSGN